MKARLYAIACVLSSVAVAHADSYYLALGDSVAFGYEKTQPLIPSNGDRGYVKPLANALGALTGVRPTVLNLALVSETSTSFADTSNIGSLLNSNYPVSGRMSQQAFAGAKISSLGGQIGTVSFAIGANDYLNLSATDQSDPAILAQAFANIQTRYTSVLSTVRAGLPSATLILPGYYNPYAPGTAPHDRAASALTTLNALVQGYAAQFNGRYVDFYTPIEGNQATLLGTGDIHPNDEGYAVLGRAAVQAVPEPNALVALGFGAIALARRQRRARAA